MTLSVRPATRRDIDIAAKLRVQLWSRLSRSSHAKELSEFLSDRKFKWWIVFDEDKPVGFAEVYLRRYVNGCRQMPVPFLEGIWVDKKYRRRGAGRMLIEKISDWASARGFAEIGSDANIKNSRSHKSHASWGFKETERVVYFRKLVGRPK